MAGPKVGIAGTTTFVMQEMEKPRQTRIFLRGSYETPGDTVSPGVPASVHVSAVTEPANRLGLARWLVDPAHPLTARVTVNRWWSEIFGAGIVRTAEDFGLQGERPTHPELLDWLAVELVQSGWSMKHVLRVIVLSAAYSQSSNLSPEMLAADPDNRWLSRSARLRLPAETVRDNALSIAGILSPAIGGPSVYPPQPPDLWWIRDDKSPVYLSSGGEDRHRRGLYTVWRRTNLHPSLALLDAPNRITCTVSRSRTNTPLQALALLNDPTYTEAAFGLARVLSGTIALSAGRSQTLEERINHGFRMATARHPPQVETDRMADLFLGRLQRFQADPDSAYRLIDSVRGDLAAGIPATHLQAAAE